MVLCSTGLFLAGPSGSGKSGLALGLIACAINKGHFAALISDDQTLIGKTRDGRLVASAPPTLFGMAEWRGTGILPVATPLSHAILHLALKPADMTGVDRVPEAGLIHDIGSGLSLPAMAVRMNDPALVWTAIAAAHPHLLPVF